MIKSQIVGGGGTNFKAAVGKTTDHGNGLITYTFDGTEKTNGSSFFRNDTYGINMNIDASTGGNVLQIHNGNDTTQWTGSSIQGVWNFSSTTQAFSGSQSIDGTSTSNNDKALFQYSSTIQPDSYTTIEGYIYVVTWPGSGTKQLLLRFRNGGTVISNNIDIGDYITTGTTNEWQKFTIPIESFAITGPFNQLVLEAIDLGTGNPIDFYIDNLTLVNATGAGSQVFTLQPDEDKIWYVPNIMYTAVGPLSGTLANGTQPNIPYYGFMGLSTLENGITIRRIVNDVTAFSTTIRDFIDFVGSPARTTLINGGDGTNSWIKILQEVPIPWKFIGSRNDRFEIVISDDLSSLIRLRAACNIFTTTNVVQYY